MIYCDIKDEITPSTFTSHDSCSFENSNGNDVDVILFFLNNSIRQHNNEGKRIAFVNRND
jgi:hypothetical protein